MIPVRHPHTTRDLGAPSNWPTEAAGPCGTLPIADTIGDAGPVMESIWEPTPAELAVLNAGGFVVLGISGTAHPVVFLTACQPAPVDG